MPVYKTRVLGLDPGYGKLGIAVIDQDEAGVPIWRYSDCLSTSPALTIAERLAIIGQTIEAVLEDWRPELAALERLFFNQNQKTALAVSEARGVCLQLAQRATTTVLEYTPSQIKQAITGYGRSDKKQIIAMLPRLIKIEKQIKEDDEYDAVAVALTALAHYPLSRLVR